MSPPSPQIRPADWGDLKAIEEIVESAYTKYVERIGSRPGPMEVDYAEALARADLFVGMEGETVTGLSVLASQSDHLLIENVAVRPSHQGRGIGSALLDHAEAWARWQGHRKLRLYTHELMVENIALYERRGYREEDRRGRNGFPLVFMAKEI
jgi:GNAT superfamily N-acetyltransferase